MKAPLRLTVLADNLVRQRGLIAENGLSLLFERDGTSILFDTGQGFALKHNAERMAIGLNRLGALALSHGHYEHSGGLGYALHAAPAATLHAHPEVFTTRYSGHANGSVHENGVSADIQREVALIRQRARLSKEPCEIAPGFFLSGEIPRVAPFEDTGGSYFLDRACTKPDPIMDEQVLYVDTPKGCVMVVGCCHCGLVNALLHVRHANGHRPIHLIIGALRVNTSDPDAITHTAATLRAMGTRMIMPLHCVNQQAIEALAEALDVKFACTPVGSVIEVHR